MNNNKIIFLLVSFVFFLSCKLLSAVVISNIEIRGNERVDSDYIKSSIMSAVGGEYNEDIVNRDIKILYSLNLFEEISTSFNNTTLIINLKENPLIDGIIFSGNKKLKSEMLEKEISSKKRASFSQNKLNADIQRITDLYYRTGYLAVSVNYSVKNKDFNRVDITINISEGEKTVIDEIRFVGNNKYGNADLENTILSKPARWWRIMNPGDTYDKNRVLYDGELLRQFYLENGYPNFALLSTMAELSPINSKFLITYVLEEGERYRFGDVIMSIQIPDLKDDESILRDTVVLDKRDWFKNSTLQKELNKMKQKISDMGYQFVSVNTQMVFNDITQSVDVVFIVEEERRVFVDKISIVGNSKSKDYVIRRELKFTEADAYNQDKTNMALRNLYKTGYFGSVDIKETPSQADGKVNLQVELEESSTGSISFGGGYSTLDKFQIDTSYEEANAFGTGNHFSVNIAFSANTNTYSVSLANPYFLEKELYTSISLFRRDTGTDTFKTGKVSNFLYKKKEQGFGFSVGYALTDYITQSFSYNLFQRDIHDVRKGVAMSIKEIEGKSLVSSISHVISYDKRDNALYPTRGMELSLRTEYAGILGNINYIKNTFRGMAYFQVYENIVFSTLLSGGIIEGLNGQRVNIVDKYNIGGPSLRGFRIGSTSGAVGPYDAQTGESLGGRIMYRGSLQLEAPVPGVKNYGLIVYAFNDWGTVTDLGKTVGVVDTGKVRSSVGVGLSWKSPAGIISLDFGFPIIKEDGDELERIFLNFGTRF